MNRIRQLALVATACLLASCFPEELPEWLVPEEELEFAKEHIALYETGEIDTILTQISFDVPRDNIEETIREMIEIYPDQELVGIELVGSWYINSTSGKFNDLTFQYQFSESWLVINVLVQQMENGLYIFRAHFQPLEESLEETNKFTIDGRGSVGYLFILFAVAIPVFIVLTFVVCLRTKIPKRKWAWAIFTLLGTSTVSLNWTTGDIGYSIISLKIFGAGFARSGLYGPWIISFAFPIGAVVFWTKRGRWLRLEREYQSLLKRCKSEAENEEQTHGEPKE